MARQPRPSKEYDPLNMARELRAAQAPRDTPKPTPMGPKVRRERDYRDILFESLFR